METTSEVLRFLESVYVRFAKWRDDGIWESVLSELDRDADAEAHSIDSTCVKARESSNGGGNGKTDYFFPAERLEELLKERYGK